MVGTIFERSSTSLQLWFYAIYAITNTRCGYSAKALERELGVTYKTAWRMFNRIRNVFTAEDSDPLSGHVEADETFFGGKLPESEWRKLRAQGIINRGPATKKRQVVFGAVERGGRVGATIVGTHRDGAGISQSTGRVRAARLDGLHRRLGRIRPDPQAVPAPPHQPLAADLRRGRHTYADHRGLFGLFKTGVRGAHHSVSAMWLQGYLNEWTWRYTW